MPPVAGWLLPVRGTGRVVSRRCRGQLPIQHVGEARWPENGLHALRQPRVAPGGSGRVHISAVGWALITKQPPALFRDNMERVRAQTQAARAQDALDEAERHQIQLDRRRVLNGWSPHGVEMYGVALVTRAARDG